MGGKLWDEIMHLLTNLNEVQEWINKLIPQFKMLYTFSHQD